MNATVTAAGLGGQADASLRVGSTQPERGGPRMRRWLGNAVCLRACAPFGRGAIMAVASFALVAAGWRAMGVGAPTAGRSTLAQLETRVALARAEVAEARREDKSARNAASAVDAGSAALALSGAHRAGPFDGGAMTEPGFKAEAEADSWPALLALVADSRLTLRTLEPARRAGHAARDGVPMRLSANGDFAALTAFLSALPSLPIATRLSGLQVTREASRLALVMDLDLLPASRARRSEGSEGGEGEPLRKARPLVTDPFRLPPRSESGRIRAPRLVGVLDDGRRRIALIETDDGVLARTAGEAVDGERLVRLEQQAAQLRGPAGTRRLALEGAAP